MPIEFRCPSCNALLRVPDDSAGRQAKCPKCGAVAAIPSPPAASPPPAPPSGDSPFGVGPAAPSESPFAADSGGDPNNPYRSPSSYSSMDLGEAPAGPIIPTVIGFDDVFRRAWDIFKARPGFCIGAWFLAGLVSNGISWIVSIAVMAMASNMDGASQMTLQQLGNIFVQVVSLWIACGQTMVFLGIARGRDASIGDLFSGGPYLLRVIGATILFILIVVGGLFLLIIPGIIFLLMFSQYLYLIVDRNVGVIESLKLSRQITSGNKGMIFLVGLAIMGLFLLWMVPGILGVVLAVQYHPVFALALIPSALIIFALMPYSLVVYVVMYLSMTGQPTAEQLRYSYPSAPTVAG